jgi:hypothetical protein
MTIATALKGTILSAALAVFSLSGAQAATKAPPKLAGDAVAGAAAFKIRCVVCHGIKADGGPIAPSLIGVFGRRYDVTLVTQYFREQFPDTHFIINYQNVRHCRLFFSIRWTRTEIVFFAINNVK